MDLGGARVLVVGARPAQIAHWRALVERCAGELLHHDGGVEDNIAGLGGLVSRADIVLFPTDCVSHEAMWSAKRLATQLGKPYRADAQRESCGFHTRAARDGGVRPRMAEPRACSACGSDAPHASRYGTRPRTAQAVAASERGPSGPPER